MTPLVIILLCLVLLFPSAWAGVQTPSLMLASNGHIHSLSEKPNAYLVSEKLDGVRAYWTGSKLISRQGKLIAAPKWFTDALPDTPIEGELWLGRGKFEKLVSITSKQQPREAEWRQVKFMLFDLPVSDLPFDKRLEKLEQLVLQANVDFLKLIPHFSYASIEQIERYFTNTVDQGGEGIMLNIANSPYLPGRQKSVLKIKPYYDAEATVIDHIAGTGKLKNLMGSLVVRNKQGQTFKIGTGFSLSERQNPPKFGQVITYKYFGLTRTGKPKFASFLRVKERL